MITSNPFLSNNVYCYSNLNIYISTYSYWISPSWNLDYTLTLFWLAYVSSYTCQMLQMLWNLSDKSEYAYRAEISPQLCSCWTRLVGFLLLPVFSEPCLRFRYKYLYVILNLHILCNINFKKYSLWEKLNMEAYPADQCLKLWSKLAFTTSNSVQELLFSR